MMYALMATLVATLVLISIFPSTAITASSAVYGGGQQQQQQQSGLRTGTAPALEYSAFQPVVPSKDFDIVDGPQSAPPGLRAIARTMEQKATTSDADAPPFEQQDLLFQEAPATAERFQQQSPPGPHHKCQKEYLGQTPLTWSLEFTTLFCLAGWILEGLGMISLVVTVHGQLVDCCRAVERRRMNRDRSNHNPVPRDSGGYVDFSSPTNSTVGHPSTSGGTVVEDNGLPEVD